VLASTFEKARAELESESEVEVPTFRSARLALALDVFTLEFACFAPPLNFFASFDDMVTRLLVPPPPSQLVLNFACMAKPHFSQGRAGE